MLSNILIPIGLANSDVYYGKNRELRILDLCTGTGCIPLLLHSMLSPSYPNLTILGVDISSKALRLAKRNLAWNVDRGHLSPSAQSQVLFQKLDVLDPTQQIEGEYDIVISNPPYVSPVAYARETRRSVRNFEPKLALVPPPQEHTEGITPALVDEGDVFYPRILQIAEACRATMVLMEFDGMKQCQCVLAMAEEWQVWDEVQVWCDGLDEAQWKRNSEKKDEYKAPEGWNRVLGEGTERAVFAMRQDWAIRLQI